MLKAFLLIVVGLAGDPEHGKTFHKWGTTMAEASERLGVPKERLVYLVDQPIEGDAGVSGRATRDEIGKALDGFAKRARSWSKAGRDSYLFMINGAKLRAPAAALALQRRLGIAPA